MAHQHHHHEEHHHHEPHHEHDFFPDCAEKCAVHVGTQTLTC